MKCYVKLGNESACEYPLARLNRCKCGYKSKAAAKRGLAKLPEVLQKVARLVAGKCPLEQ